jgi:MFS superfamily sulfate permease-like transporter
LKTWNSNSKTRQLETGITFAVVVAIFHFFRTSLRLENKDPKAFFLF